MFIPSWKNFVYGAGSILEIFPRWSLISMVHFYFYNAKKRSEETKIPMLQIIQHEHTERIAGQLLAFLLVTFGLSFIGWETKHQQYGLSEEILTAIALSIIGLCMACARKRNQDVRKFLEACGKEGIHPLSRWDLDPTRSERPKRTSR